MNSTSTPITFCQNSLLEVYHGPLKAFNVVSFSSGRRRVSYLSSQCQDSLSIKLWVLLVTLTQQLAQLFREGKLELDLNIPPKSEWQRSISFQIDALPLKALLDEKT